ncbi:oxygenase [Lithospermum erythrorhizon]|uniref:Geranylhydroquinone 3''-hydroxylase n=1 Tax=Lithospermum erythrorhizon TaxID=34254 RepID=A0A6M3TXH1_LITER|nr:geranylhydroquinone 3''-hydroxylase [Lithospermum erythrorhizon]
MGTYTILLGLLFGFTILVVVTSLSRKKKNLPPGPSPLPIIGSLHLLGSQALLSLLNLTNKYGPIMCLNLGSIPTIIVSTPNIAREFLQKNDLAFSGKRIPDALHAHDHFKYSVSWLPANTQWRSIRKVLTSNIFTNNRLEANQHLRSRKVQELITFCHKSCKTGEAVEVGQAFFRTTLNLLSNTIFSKDLTDHSMKTKAAEEFKDCVWNILVESAKPNLVDFFPILRIFDPQGIRRRNTALFGKILDIFDGLINERMEQRKLNGFRNTDVLDTFLTYQEEHPDELDAKHVKHSLMDLFIAGVDTTASISEWALAELIKNPAIMKHAKNELEDVIGKGKVLEEDDISHLPYLKNIVKETVRLHPPGPFLFPRQPEKDVEVCGYTIPKGSQVLVSIWALGRDPNLWENPLMFNPDRYKKSDLDFRGQNFELIPFGAGRRICPGIPLAVKMVPLMLGSMINSFNWELEGAMKPEELNMEERIGLTLQMAFPLRAVPVPL